MEISKVIRNVLYRYPLFGNIIANIKFEYTNENVPAPIFTDGNAIYYKSDFWSFTPLEQEFLIAHEILHIVLRHLFRNLGKDPQLLNYVEDGIINQILIRDGLPMPKGGVNIPDALNYSVEELYLRFLPKMDEIKSWMNANTYHVEIVFNDSKIEEVVNNSFSDELSKNLNKNLQNLMNENSSLRSELIEAYKNSLKNAANAKQVGSIEESEPLGKSGPLVSWQSLLSTSIKCPNNSGVLFREIEPDGILRKEFKNNPNYAECEIIIDSSGSMNLNKIKSFLRECKNILSTSQIKVGFCDTVFYGWHEIRTEDDIDNLQIIGRGGTDFQVMANSFTPSVDNKLVLTDGEDVFPTDRPDILWVVISYCLSYVKQNQQSNPSINIIYIDEQEIELPAVKKIGSYN